MSHCPYCGVDQSATLREAWSFHVPHMPPSQNDFKAAWPPKGATLAKLRQIMIAKAVGYSKLVEAWGARLAEAGHRSGLYSATVKRRVIFTRILGPRNRLLDQPNFIGGIKPVLDALVNVEGLVDDSAKHFEGYYHQRKQRPGEEPGLGVDIEEPEPAQGELTKGK